MAENDAPQFQYDPTNYTVEQVNDYLASDTTTDDERARVLAAESDGKARQGILTGPQGPRSSGDDAEPASGDEPTGETLLATTSTDPSTGVVGDTAGPDDAHAVKPADQSAPENPAEVGTVGTPGGLETNAPATIQDQEAPDLEGEHYRQGYVGNLPDADNRPDLTLQGVLGQNASTTDTEA